MTPSTAAAPAPVRLRVRVAAPHPRVGEAVRILARVLLRTAREKGLDSGSSLSPYVAPRGGPAPE